MNYWLMKSEPEEYSIDDLQCDTTGFWDGIRNYQVRNMLRDDFTAGDLALFYHSNAGKETGVAGVMEVVGEAASDPVQFKTKSKYFDAKSPRDNPRWFGVTVRFVQKFSRTVLLSELKDAAVMASSPLVRKGNRLSIIPLTKRQFDYICKQGQ